jgi:solute carrier family 35, member F5
MISSPSHHKATNMPLMGWTRNYVIGLLFIVLVAVIWAASSVLIQLLYTSTDNDFHSPFLVTYIGVSLFTLWLPTQKLTQYLYRPIISTPERVTAPNVRRRRTAAALETTTTTYHAVNVGTPESHGQDEDGTAEDAPRLDQEQDSPSRKQLQEIQEHDLRSSIDHDVADSTADNADSLLSDDNDIVGATNSQELMAVWTEADHLRAALYIAPVWFVANWTYNASLAYTSVSSSTVLSSTGSLFTFLFAIWAGDETFSRTALCGVVLGVAGSVLTTRNDASSGNDNENSHHHVDNAHPHGVLGDVLGLISAVGYGMYAVQTRVLCPPDEAMYSMQTLLGYIGLLNMVVLSPLAIYLLLSGSAHLGWTVLSVLVVKGLLDNVLSDYLWLRAVMLTNATTATVGLGLTIPLAFASDVFLDHGSESVISVARVCGALAVLAGFVLVNIGNASTGSDDNGDSELESLSVVNAPSPQHSRLPLYTDTEQKEPESGSPDAVMT